MSVSQDELYVNIPISNLDYIFNVPEDMYSDAAEAVKSRSAGEMTVTLREALKRIAADIRHDA